MYAYTDFDRQFIRQRAAQFRDQLERNLAGQLGDDEFRPLRLQNGWYVQRHAPMPTPTPPITPRPPSTVQPILVPDPVPIPLPVPVPAR